MTEEKTILEKEIIGAILNRPKQLHSLRRALVLDAFSIPFHRKVMQAILECVDNGHEVNYINVVNTGKLTSGESVSLAEIGEEPGDLRLLSRRLTEHVLQEKYTDLKGFLSEERDPFEVLDEIKRVENEATALIGRNTRRDKQDILTSYLDYILGNAKDGVKRIPTGVPTLDRMLSGGLAQGDISFVGGTPGSGKTSFMLSIALHAAQEGFKTGFIEGEMTSNEIMERLNGISTGHDIDKIRSGRDCDNVTTGFVSDLFNLPLEIMPCYERTIEVLTSRVREAVHEGCRLIFVDYLQVFTPKGKAEDEYSQIKKLSETLRQIALQNGVHLCVASSLNRSEAGQRQLTLNSYYGSSQLGHDCAVGMLLSGDQNDDQELENRQRIITVQVVKNRSGARGPVRLKFHLSSQRMEETLDEPAAVGFEERNNGAF